MKTVFLKNLLSLGGFSYFTVQNCTNKLRYYGTSTAALIPAVMAAVATYFYLDVYKASIPGKLSGVVLAFLTMLLIESIMMRTFVPTDKVWKNLLRLGALTRIGLLCAIVMFFSGILEIQTAQSEINAELKVMLSEEIEVLRDKEKQEIADIERRYQSKIADASDVANDYMAAHVSPAQSAYDTSKKRYIDEIDGNAASGARGHGTVAAQKLIIKTADSLILATETQEYNRLRSKADTLHAAMASEMAIAADTHKERVNTTKQNFSDGIYSRKAALQRLKDRNKAIWWQSLFLSMMLLFMDIIGLVSKYTLTTKDEYYTLKEKEERENDKVVSDRIDLKAQIDKQALNQELNKIVKEVKKEEIEFNREIADIERDAKVDDMKEEIELLKTYGKEFTDAYNSVKYKDKEVEHMTKKIMLALGEKQFESFIQSQKQSNASF